jgi:hypothetical protein
MLHAIATAGFGGCALTRRVSASKLIAILAGLAGVVAPRGAAGEHDHGAPHDDRDGHAPQTFVVGVGLVAATYDQTLYTGDYQGATLAAGWTRGRVGLGASAAWYQLTRNGMEVRGIADTSLHGQYTFVTAGAFAAGGVLAVSVPTGDAQISLGMGHAMVMPAAWATWAPDRFAFAGSCGYGRALGDAGAHAEHHGGGPIVDPMNVTEVTFGASGLFALTRGLRAGARLAGGIPIASGNSRLTGGVRVAWAAGRLDTTFDVQAGLVGDPYELRGVLGTAVRFH